MSSVISERTFSNRRRPPHSSMMNHRSSGGGGSSNRSVIGGGVDSRHFLLPHNHQQQHFNGFHPNESMEDRWAGGDENTTVITGATSEHSFGGGQNANSPQMEPFPPPPGQSLGRIFIRRFSWFCWLFCAFLISFLALISAPLMVSLPHLLAQFNLLDDWAGGGEQMVLIGGFGGCQVDCQGQLLNLAGKSALLLLALYVLFWRRSAADMPRLFLHRAAFAFFVFFVLFAFWLFYIVRILMERNAQPGYVLSFAISLVDLLLFIHCIWIFFELRQLRPVFCLQIVRDPDGEWRSHELGQMSIQEAAVSVLRLYKCHFPIFNANLVNSRRSSALGRFRSMPAPIGFKLYDIERRAGTGGGEEGTAALSEMNARILMQAASQRRMAGGHNELFHEEFDWERRFRKRKCRLISCTEEIFAQVQATEAAAAASKTAGGQQIFVEPMDPQMAAKAVLASIAKQLNRFLRFTRQEHFHQNGQLLAHLQRCLAFGFSARTFLQRFFANSQPIQEVLPESKWSILCDSRVSGPLCHGLQFVLRCHDSEGVDRGVQLQCTISAFPFLNLTEQPSPQKSFQLKVLAGNPPVDLGV